MGLLVAGGSVRLISRWNVVCLGGSLKVSGATLVSQVHAGEGAQSQGSAVRRPQPGTSCLSRNPPGPWGVIWHLQP